MIEAQMIFDLCCWLETTHDAQAKRLAEAKRNGCKSSCGSSEVGFHYEPSWPRGEDLPTTEWYCHFGGYCFSDLNRWHEVKAGTLVELIDLVKKEVLEAIEREEVEIQNEIRRREVLDMIAPLGIVDRPAEKKEED